MSAKPTAFARVPRGKPTTGTTKTVPPIRIDANFLERLEKANMSPDLSTVMTKTDTKLSIEVNAQGGIGYSLLNKVGKTVADKADIKRIQTMTSSITKERKAALNDELGNSTKFLLMAFVQKSKESADFQPIQKFHKGFVQILRTVNTEFQMVTKNLHIIEAIPTKEGTPENTVKDILIEMGRRISVAVGQFLFHRAVVKEEQTPEKLNAFLFKEHVPGSIYSRLSKQLINTSVQGFVIEHLLFPKDPSKGVTLSFKEIRDATFRNDLMGLMEGSQLLIQLALNDKLVRLMINVKEDTPLDNFEEQNSLAAKLANTPFYLVPFKGVTTLADYFGNLAKNGVRGTVWESGTVLTPVDLLKFYGTIAKRMFHVLITRPQHKVSLIEGCFPGFRFDIEKDQEDVFVQLKNWALTPGNRATWFASVRKYAENAHAILSIRKMFNDVVAVSKDHIIAETFSAMIVGPAVAIHAGSSTGSPLHFTEVKNLALTLRASGGKPDEAIVSLAGASQGKKPKKVTIEAGLAERSRLTQESRDAVKELKTRGYVALAERMQTWFRLFIDESIQEAVAALFVARLESFLETPLQVTREERQGFMDPSNPDDDMPEEKKAVVEAQQEDDQVDNPDDE